jgi:hypothetical protein
MGVDRVVYLDQNQWIELARSVNKPEANPATFSALELLIRAAVEGRLQVPLTFTNIYETHKINHPERRRYFAWIQATLSQGLVFRSRSAILRAQLTEYLCRSFSVSVPKQPSHWFLSTLFFEAAAEYDPSTFGFAVSERVLAYMRSNPPKALFDYLTEVPDDIRRRAVQNYSASSRDLIDRIQQRRARLQGEPLALRKRAYGAQLLIDHIDLVFELATEIGLPLKTLDDLGSSRARAMMTDVPVLNIERELVLRVESEDRTIDENDLRDVAGLTAALPYADIVVGEKAFLDRARQAKLGERYDTHLLTSLTQLTPDLLR